MASELTTTNRTPAAIDEEAPSTPTVARPRLPETSRPRARRTALPLVPTAGLARGDAVYARILALAFDPADPSFHRDALDAVGAIEEARRLYLDDAANVDALRAIAHVRIADLYDLLPELVDPTGPPVTLVIDFHCLALEHYVLALSIEPRNLRAAEQLRAYGEPFRRHCERR